MPVQSPKSGHGWAIYRRSRPLHDSPGAPLSARRGHTAENLYVAFIPSSTSRPSSCAGRNGREFQVPTWSTPQAQLAQRAELLTDVGRAVVQARRSHASSIVGHVGRIHLRLRRCARERRLQNRERLVARAVVLQVARGLHAAHAARSVCCDCRAASATSRLITAACEVTSRSATACT